MNKHLIKMVLKNGHVLALYADDPTLDELQSHPKFLRMQDEGNEVFMSIEDVAAFEVVSNRVEPPKPAEGNGETQEAAQA